MTGRTRMSGVVGAAIYRDKPPIHTNFVHSSGREPLTMVHRRYRRGEGGGGRFGAHQRRDDSVESKNVHSFFPSLGVHTYSPGLLPSDDTLRAAGRPSRAPSSSNPPSTPSKPTQPFNTSHRRSSSRPVISLVPELVRQSGSGTFARSRPRRRGC